MALGHRFRAALPDRSWPRPAQLAGRGGPEAGAAAVASAVRGAAMAGLGAAARLGLSHMPYLSAMKTDETATVSLLPCGSRRSRARSSCSTPLT